MDRLLRVPPSVVVPPNQFRAENLGFQGRNMKVAHPSLQLLLCYQQTMLMSSYEFTAAMRQCEVMEVRNRGKPVKATRFSLL